MQPPGLNGITISIIVPARNEEACLGRCLASLVAQADVSFEIIVVDDGSTDRTRQIAESFPCVRVIDAYPLESNWTGKNNAVFTGTRVARGSWLLFTDADTEHRPGSLARALTEAQHHNASLLSYSPEQEVFTFWEKALMPVIFAELAATYRPSDVTDPESPAAAANGQYILITRDIYDEVGGHAGIAASLLEDVDLASAVKKAGHNIFFRYGADAVRTRMYRNYSALKEGWTKNLALLFHSPIRLASLRLAEFAWIAGGTAGATILASRGNTVPALAAAGIILSSYLQFLWRVRRAHFSWPTTAMSFLGLPLFSYLLLRSHTKRQITWKDRTYAATPGSHVGPTARGNAVDPRSAAI